MIGSTADLEGTQMQLEIRRLTRARFVALAVLLATIGLVWPGAHAGRAWPGGLDGTYADGGGTAYEGEGYEFPVEIVTLSQGGTVTLMDVANGAGMLKLDAKGRRVTGFGTGGVVTVNYDEGRPVDLVALPDGKLVVLLQGMSFALRRYTAAGTPDLSFGDEGVASIPYTEGTFGAGALALQPDGKLVVAGITPNGSPNKKAVWRFNAGGDRDQTFGSNGSVSFAAGDGYSEVTSVVVQPDGGIVGGTTNSPGGTIFRVTPNGALDQSFGAQGIVSTPAYVRDLVQGPNGTLLYAGRVGDSWTSYVYRLTAAGAPAGTSEEIPGESFGLTVTSDGRPVAVGKYVSGSQSGDPLFVARLTSSLALDPTFGVDGLVAYGARDSIALAATVQPDGRIIVAAGDRDLQNVNDTVVLVLGIHGGFPLGLELDGWGGLHALSAGRSAPATTFVGAPYWKGWDIARGVVLKGDTTGGYELDGWGGIHSFGVNGHAPPARVNGGPYWPGWDIARDITILPDETGGYVLDGWGGLHPFGLNGHAAPPRVTTGPYWPGWDIARGVDVLPDGSGGHLIDGWGGIHPFAIGDNPVPEYVENGPYWPGWDIARDVQLNPFGGAYVLDGWGGIHAFPTYEGDVMPPMPTGAPYWRGWDISRSLSMP